MDKELTGPQSTGISGGLVISHPKLEEQFLERPISFTSYREMRADPTIALTRALNIAAVVSGEWTVEVKPDAPAGVEEFISDLMFPMREVILQVAMEGCIDFGWQPWEKIYYENDGIIGVRLKPLLQDITTIMVSLPHHHFAGFKQESLGLSGVDPVYVPLRKSLNIAFGVEGTNWYGRSILENARRVYNDWVESNTGARRYDKKIAGTHWVIYYPNGNTLFRGVMTPNPDIAIALMTDLESSGCVAIPSEMQQTKDGPVPRWKVELVSDRSARQSSFVPRLEYCDTRKVRAMISPERTTTEGKFGTKAEAGTHVEVALAVREQEHRCVTRHVNWYVVDDVLELNYGPRARGTAHLKAAPLVNTKLGFFRDIYRQIIEDDRGFKREVERLDVGSLRDAVGLTTADIPEPFEEVEPSKPVDAIVRRGD